MKLKVVSTKVVHNAGDIKRYNIEFVNLENFNETMSMIFEKDLDFEVGQYYEMGLVRYDIRSS